MSEREWETRVRAYLLVADLSEATIAAIIGHVRSYGTVERLGLVDAEVRDAVEAMLP